MAPSDLIAFLVRLMLVALFLPFSALAKLLDFRGAVAQAREAVPSKPLGVLLILCGLVVEVVMSSAILLGLADRAAALVLAAYCVVTALIWKQFWRPGDFRSGGPNSKARAVFWDFWKNLALAGGCQLLTFGTSARSVETVFAAPCASIQPYQTAGEPQP